MEERERINIPENIVYSPNSKEYNINMYLKSEKKYY
jgi:hypothetical protein